MLFTFYWSFKNFPQKWLKVYLSFSDRFHPGGHVGGDCCRRLSPSEADYGRSETVLPRDSGRPREAGEPVGGPWEAGTSGRVEFWSEGIGGRKSAQRAPPPDPLMQLAPVN